MTKLSELKRRWLKDPEFKTEYERLELVERDGTDAVQCAVLCSPEELMGDDDAK